MAIAPKNEAIFTEPPKFGSSSLTLVFGQSQSGKSSFIKVIYYMI